ncbi:MAG: type IX secretion system membrane protein PorP/SprF [Chloroflexota bacterium]|nr:type IX secretion system membrane protein PorP/SprF [Lentimicrobium sp.]
MHKKLLTLLLIISAVSLVRAQDPSFSQFYGNPMYLNPALTGSKICPRLTLNYRNQWPGIEGTFVTYSASYDQFVQPLSGGIGVMVVSENMAGGAMTSNAVHGAYSFRLELSKKLTLNTGFQGSYMQNKLNWDKLIFEDQYLNSTGGSGLPQTQESPPDHPTVSMIDFSAGMLLGYNDRSYFGVAVHHMNQPDNSYYSNGDSKLDMKITAHAGALIGLGDVNRSVEVEDLSVSPNIMYQQQGEFHQLNAGMYLNMYPFVLGGWFRHNFENPDAVIVLLGFMGPKFKIGYSYDYTISKLTNVTGGAHEISLVYQFDCHEKTFKQKAIKCPRF